MTLRATVLLMGVVFASASTSASPPADVNFAPREVLANVETDAFPGQHRLDVMRTASGDVESLVYVSDEGERILPLESMRGSFQVAKVHQKLDAVLMAVTPEFSASAGGYATLRVLYNGVGSVFGAPVAYRNFRVRVTIAPASQAITLISEPDLSDPDSDRNPFTGPFNYLFMKKNTTLGRVVGIRSIVPGLKPVASPGMMEDWELESTSLSTSGLTQFHWDSLTPALISPLPYVEVAKALDDPKNWARDENSEFLGSKELPTNGCLWNREISLRINLGDVYRIPFTIQETLQVCAEGHTDRHGGGIRRYRFWLLSSSREPGLTPVVKHEGTVEVWGLNRTMMRKRQSLTLLRPIDDPDHIKVMMSITNEVMRWFESFLDSSS